jgi:Ca2+-binding EF-hand superfamily protein
MERYDWNQDGRLAQNELPQHMQQNFAELDRNRDGSISGIELRIHARRMQRLSAMPVEVTYIWVTGADRGRLNLRELQQAYSLLRKIDKNDDGQIAQSELRETRRQVATQWVDCIFEHCDENDDGQIDRNEARDTAMSYAFSRFDRNQDDRLSRNELRQVATSDERDREGQSEGERSARRTERESEEYSEEQ